MLRIRPFGAGLGGGYEFSPHWAAQLDVGFGKAGDFDNVTAMLKLMYLYY